MLGEPSVAVHAPRAAEGQERRDGRTELRWQGWADWPLSGPLLLLAGAAVVLDVATAWTGTSLGSLGRIAISPGLPPALLVLAGIGAGRLGASRRSLAAWREVAIGLGAVLALATLGYALTLGRPSEAGGLLVAALGEELVFRLCAVVVLGALAARLLRRDWRSPRTWGGAPGYAALLGAAIVFSALPGHVAQMHGPSASLSFASLALVLGYVVLRTGALWPAVIVHALLDVTTLAAWQGAGSPGVRLALAATALVALVAGADVAGRRLGVRVRVPQVIDLRTTSRAVPTTPGG